MSESVVSSSFLRLAGGHFIYSLGASSFFLLPVHLQNTGASHAEIALIMSMTACSALLMRPLAGWALDTMGRKPLLFAGTACVTVSLGLVWFVHEAGWQAYVSRLLMGIGIALLLGYVAWIADIVPSSRRTEGLALFGVSGLLPLALMPLYRMASASTIDFPLLFALMAGVVLVSCGPWWTLAEPARQSPRQPFSWRALWVLVQQPSLRPVWLITALFASMMSCFMVFSMVSAKKQGIADPSLVWLTYGGSAILVRLSLGHLPDRFGPANMLVPASVCYAFSLLLLASVSSTQGLLWAGFLGGLGHAFGFPVLTSLIVSRVPGHLRGSGLSLYSMCWGISELTFTPLLGLFADRFGDSAMFSLVALVACVVLLAWVCLEHRTLVHEPSPA